MEYPTDACEAREIDERLALLRQMYEPPAEGSACPVKTERAECSERPVKRERAAYPVPTALPARAGISE
jgi:hypothetical protein